MNGDWNTYHASPAAFKAMWKRVVNVFRRVIPQDAFTKNRIQFVFAPNCIDIGIRMEKYYPGSKYVDWLGIDGYNWGAKQRWVSAKTIFDKMLKRLRKLAKKPVAILETSSTSQASKSKKSAAKKEKWIADAMKYFKARKLRMVLWFNEMKETDWQLFGPGASGSKKISVAGRSYRYYAQFIKALRGKYWIGGSLANPRRVSDKAFRGR